MIFFLMRRTSAPPPASCVMCLQAAHRALQDSLLAPTRQLAALDSQQKKRVAPEVAIRVEHKTSLDEQRCGVVIVRILQQRFLHEAGHQLQRLFSGNGAGQRRGHGQVVKPSAVIREVLCLQVSEVAASSVAIEDLFEDDHSRVCLRE